MKLLYIIMLGGANYGARVRAWCGEGVGPCRGDIHLMGWRTNKKSRSEWSGFLVANLSKID